MTDALKATRDQDARKVMIHLIDRLFKTSRTIIIWIAYPICLEFSLRQELHLKTK